MRDLVKFFTKYSVFILFLFLELISFALLTHSGNGRFSVYFSTANSVNAEIVSTTNEVAEFFKLRSTNALLSDENTRLLNRVTELENELTMAEDAKKGYKVYTPADNDLQYISAKVVNISTNLQKNHITINRGKRDGVEVDMGVICADGVVGIVKQVSDKFAVVMPILNTDLKINGRFESTSYAGPVVWDGVDYRYVYLQEIARHVKFKKNDYIVTSGLTTIFPEGVRIGRVESATLGANDSYYNIKVKLATNFRTLSYVQVIRNKNRVEQHNLEEAATEDVED